MDMQDREYIGILADEDEADGRDNVFINKGSYIQYRVKSLLLPQESPTLYLDLLVHLKMIMRLVMMNILQKKVELIILNRK